MKVKVVVLALLAGMLLGGCGQTDGNAGQTEPGASVSAEASSDAQVEPIPVEVSDIQSGVKLLGSLTKDFKQSLEAGDEAKAKELAGQIAGAWNAIKEEVKTSGGELYPELEQKVGAFLTAAAGSKIDKDLLIQQDYELYQRFRDLSRQLQGEAVQAN